MSSEDNNTHILENKWVLSEQYYIDNKLDRVKGYENSFEKLCIIGSIEMFWSYWKVLPAISDVFFNGNERIVEKSDARNPSIPRRKVRIIGQCIFKEGIEPKYEDPQNENGGHIMCVFGKEDHLRLSIFWESVVMGLIGETIDDADNITGARVIDKSNISTGQVSHRVEIWFRDFENEAFKTRIEEYVRLFMKNSGCVSTEVSIHRNDYSKWKKTCCVCFKQSIEYKLNFHFFHLDIVFRFTRKCHISHHNRRECIHENIMI